MKPAAFLNSCHFVARGLWSPPGLWRFGAHPVLLSALLAAGCAAPRGGAPMEDTETSGRISIAAAQDVHALARAEADSFRLVYRQAKLDLRDPESSGQVISALLAGRADVAVAGRELEEEERNVARQNGIELEGHRIGEDAMGVVVPAANPVRNVTLGELQRIWTGETRSWAALGGPDARVVPILPPLSSDLARSFAQRVMAGEAMRAPSEIEPSDSAVAARVAALPGGIGVVRLALAAAPRVPALRSGERRG